MLPATKHFLSNGVRVITVPRAESSVINILILTETGSKDENKKENGLSHFLEHTCFKGTEKRPGSGAISMELDSFGAQYNAFTAQEFTGYYATAAAKHHEEILDLLADMYQNATFPESEIEKERGVIIEEINMYEDQPQHLVGEVLMSLLYDDQAAGRSIAGTKETVSNFHRADLLRYRDAHYIAAKTIIVIAGQIEEASVLKKITALFDSMPRQTRPERLAVKEEQKQPELAIKFKNSDQTHLLLGFRSFAINDSRRYPLDILAGILGGGMSSRLFRRIRDEMGAAYYVHANNDFFLDHGLLEIAVGADNQRAAIVVRAILEECRRLRQQLVAETELARVKEMLIGNFQLSLETTAGLTSYYGQNEIWLGKIISPEAIIDCWRAVTPRAVQEVAQTVLANPRLNLALIGPVSDSSIFASGLEIE